MGFVSLSQVACFQEFPNANEENGFSFLKTENNQKDSIMDLVAVLP